VIAAGSLGIPFLVGLPALAKPMSRRFSLQLEFRDEEAPLLRLLGLSQFFEIVNVTCCSILRAASRPNIGPSLYVCVHYIIMIPLAWVLAFPANIGLFGMWLCYTIACMLICVILAVVVWQTSFEVVARVRTESINRQVELS